MKDQDQCKVIYDKIVMKCKMYKDTGIGISYILQEAKASLEFLKFF